MSIERRKHGVTEIFIYISAKGRECISNPDCASIGGTSCVKDYDQRLRCLCGDYRAPINGLCQSGFKGLQAFFVVQDNCKFTWIFLKQFVRFHLKLIII